ncbi:unnamed protein product [Lactuca virosa]|uniref:Replication protein A 70 kDa DNA-binding subunit B/D first OB fold domain-containing protein n=1 Tax=Lactuca virosa TaxID=75947 RepID=A0AAU9MMA8_9ASTR|nr:unnamed protein product [Lactuca virosa]
MAHNSGDEIVFDSLADIDASNETWNIRVHVLMLWKQTYKNNPNMVSSLDMILMDQQATIKKNLINVFQTLFDEGAVREINKFGMDRNEGDYMLVGHKHKINFYKTTTVRVSAPFVDRTDPFNFVTFHDLTARNFDTRVAFGQPQVGNCLFGSRLHINDDMHHISEFNKAYLNTDTVVAKAEDYYLRFPIKNIDDIPDYNKTNASIHFYCHDCSKKVSKNDDDSNVEPFTCDGCGGVSDVYGKMRVVIRVQDKTRIKDVKISLMSLIAF